MSSPATYSPPMFDPAVDLDLSRNEGRTRGSELLAAVADPDRAISRYPDTSAVRARLADLHGLGPDHVLVTAGGDDALNRCFLALVGTGRRAVTTYPTFEMIPRYAEQRDVELVEVPWWTGPFPVDEVLGSVASDIDAIFLVSPNNPTGAALTETDLKRVSEVFPFVVLDAAYAEFGDVDLTAAALELGNVAVIRTLSKAYGLAGLRVGYLLAKPATVARVGAFGSPYPVSALSAAVAVTRLGWPESETTGFVDRIIRERSDLFAILGDLGTRPYPSQGNFILTECDNAGWVVDASRSLGVALRHFPSRAGMEDMVRITLPGDEPDFDRLVSALSAVMAPQAIIFDLDGVIADVSRSQTIAIIETAQSYGVIVSPSDVELAKAGGSANNDWELARRLCAQNGVDADLDGLTERYERLYQGEDGISGLKQHEQAVVGPERWRDWAGRLPLGIVTGRPRRDAEEFLTRFGLLDMVSALVTMEDAPLKPDPAPVRRVLELLGVSHAWMLGDTPDDLQAARAAGVVPIGVVAPGDDVSRAREVLRSAAHILERTTDLEGLFS